MKRLAFSLATTFFAALPLAAQAVEFKQVIAEQSNVNFIYKQMGVAVDGKFKRFSSQLVFDPAKPAAASVNFTVDLASVDTGAAEGDDEVAGKSWFNTKTFPTARFVSSKVKALGGNRYQVNGQLSIKGKTQDVVVPATFTAQGNNAIFAGGFTLRRGDFLIGEGPWAAFDIVANEVQIKFHISATAK